MKQQQDKCVKQNQEEQHNVFIDSLERTTNSGGSCKLPKKMFMGFGYNPKLRGAYGCFPDKERIDMLDYFAWMKRLEGTGVERFFIWDASGYAIVNIGKVKPFRNLGENPTGAQILEVVVAQQEVKKREEFRKNCDARKKFLNRSVEVTGVNATYLDAREVFREEAEEFGECLDLALEEVKRLEVEKSGLVKAVYPNGIALNEANKLYLPLEIAEAEFLRRKEGVGGKYGPATEMYFDECILSLQDRLENPYVTVRSPVGTRKPAYLFEERALWTTTPDEVVKRMLESGSYQKFVESYTAPFRLPEEPLLACVIRLKNQLSEVNKDE